MGDDLPYTNLNYANGKGYYYHTLVGDSGTNVTRRNLSEVPTEVLVGFDFVQASKVILGGVNKRFDQSSIMSSTSFQLDKTVWGVVSAAVEQSNSKAV